MDNKWHKPSEKPEKWELYANKYIRVIADDEGGFVREAFYDIDDDEFIALGIWKRGELYRIPLVVTRWRYLPNTENKE